VARRLSRESPGGKVLSMLAELKELWRFRELMLSLVERDLRIRYKNSFFGFFWSLINPLVTVLVMTVVFKYLLGSDTPNLSAYILAAYLPYMFFQLALMDSSQSVIASLPVVRKVYFPREVLPLATVASNFVHFLLALAVFFAYLLSIWARNPQIPPFEWSMLWLPLLLVVNLALCAGLALIVSALNTFYEDVKYVLGVGLYLLFFLSPIMYFSENVYHAPVAQASPWVYTLYHLNPVAMLATAYRKVLLAPQDVEVDGRMVPPLPLDWGLLGVTALISFGLLVGGYALFNGMKWRFVERP
jgi:ABC-type polysaccharide/polyol phosphate export permease